MHSRRFRRYTLNRTTIPWMRSSQSAKRCIRRRQLFEISRRCFGWQAAFCVALNLSLMERFRQWPLAKINDRALKNVARLVDTQPRATVAVEKRQAKFALMNINPFFAGTRDRKVPHKRYDVAGRTARCFAQQRRMPQSGPCRHEYLRTR